MEKEFRCACGHLCKIGAPSADATCRHCGAPLAEFSACSDDRSETDCGCGGMEGARGEVKRVLVLEDDEKLNANVCRVLANNGYDVRSLPSGEAVAEATKDFCPHLIIADIMMPGHSGIKICECVCGNGEPVKPQVLIVSALDDRQIKKQARDAGAVGFVTKPFRLSELLLKVEKLIGPARTGDEKTPCAADG